MKYSIISALATMLILQACTGSYLDTSDRQSNQQPVTPLQSPLHKNAQQPVEEKESIQHVIALTEHRGASAPSRMKKSEAQIYGAMQVKPFVSVADQIRLPREALDRENYRSFDDSPVKLVTESPVSTFSVDVDTGAYSNMRRFLNQGRIPDRQAIRTEELVNYFSYDYSRPVDPASPFSLVTEIAPTPWNRDSYLLHIGLQGYEMEKAALPSANLVFLVDVSGSMQSENKLGLLKSGLKLLVKQMNQDDRISLVVYAGASGVVLEPTPGDQKATINTALDSLTAGGSTNGAAGIRLAYQMAKQSFIKGGINRILLATDGDFNVGTTNFDALKQLVEQERNHGVSLTTLGFGTGNYNDHLMEQLADSGNGNYSYIDNLNEARKVLVEEMEATLNTIAKDVKIQIEFNPELVAEYRLIGYENRSLKREDFNNDKVDAGEIGAGHSVTALYEISLKDSQSKRIDELRYQKTKPADSHSNELALIRLRYKQPDETNSRLIEKILRNQDLNTKTQSADFRFSAAVAAFGQQLRGGRYLNEFSYDDILKLARESRGKDPFGYRGEFIQLVSLAKSLQ